MKTGPEFYWAWGLLCASFLFTFIDIIMLLCWLIRPRRRRLRRDYSYNNNTGKHIMMFSACLLFSIFFLRLTIGLFNPLTGTGSATWYDRVPGSMLHALQTFSMDEAYDDTLQQGKALLGVLLCEKAGRKWITAFGIYISALNVVAPIAGGAFIFEILAGIFPLLRYWFSFPMFLKNRYFFTALNEQSVALAKSIASNPKKKHVQLIFTDAYADNEDEETTELLLTARAMGAICLKDDLLHISLPRHRLIKSEKIGTTRIFLSDRSEDVNLQSLSELLGRKRQKKLKKTEIFVFGADNKTTCIEEETEYICNRVRAEIGEIRPHVIPVNGIRNLAQNLFYDLPLYECLYGKDEEDREINLTIIGSGTIGTELFLNAYWFGQLHDVRLNINVVSKVQTQAEFESRINYINPDILQSSKAGSKLLYAGIDDTCPYDQPPYFHFRFCKADVFTSELDTIMTKGIGEEGDRFPLQDSDFFIIAAGSDTDNYSIAEKIRQSIGCYHFQTAKKKKTIISYVIYSSSLCRTLNMRPRLQTVPAESGLKAGEFDIYMHAFGSMEEIFSCNNILLDRVRAILKRVKNKETFDDEKPDRTYNYYNERANRTRALHIIYKAFSAGAVKPTLFCSKSDDEYIASKEKIESDYAALVREKLRQEQPDGGAQCATVHQLAWLEHRRWNAFMRIYAFRCPPDYADYEHLDSDVHKLGTDKFYQFLFLKQHPCILESRPEAFCIPAEVREAVNPELDYDHLEIRDRLDQLSVRTRQPFKAYDYPEIELR